MVPRGVRRRKRETQVRQRHARCRGGVVRFLERAPELLGKAFEIFRTQTLRTRTEVPQNVRRKVFGRMTAIHHDRGALRKTLGPDAETGTGEAIFERLPFRKRTEILVPCGVPQPEALREDVRERRPPRRALLRNVLELFRTVCQKPLETRNRGNRRTRSVYAERVRRTGSGGRIRTGSQGHLHVVLSARSRSRPILRRRGIFEFRRIVALVLERLPFRRRKNRPRERRGGMVLEKRKLLEIDGKIRRRPDCRRETEHGREVPQTRQEHRRAHRGERSVHRRARRLVRIRGRRRNSRRRRSGSREYRKHVRVTEGPGTHGLPFARSEMTGAVVRPAGSRTRRSRKFRPVSKDAVQYPRNGERNLRGMFEQAAGGEIGAIPGLRRRHAFVGSFPVTRKADRLRLERF